MQTQKDEEMSAQTAAGMVAAAKQRIENLTPEQVRAEANSDNNVLIVDIRDSEERAASGTIPCAVHASRGMLEFYADPTSPYHRAEFDPNRRVILHCASGGRSALATETLQQLGYADVAHLDGGFKAWAAAGYPVKTL